MSNPIPLNGAISIPDTSDLYGNIEYTKNINLSDPGYIKLASRTAYLLSQFSNSNFGLPISFGRKLNDQYYICTKVNSFIANTDIANYLISADGGTSAPTSNQQGFGLFWNNLWHVSDNVFDVWIKNRTTGNWSVAGGTFFFTSSGVSHMLEPFKSKGTLCGADGNIVRQCDTSYSFSSYAQLTIPPDYEITAISYNNQNMAVATKIASSLQSWQNGEAFLFIWDGAGVSAGASYPVGSDTIICLAPYKSSWVLLTRKGRLLYFNGGGFDELARFNFNYKNRIWGDPITLKMFGSCITVEDDLIYINLPTQYNASNSRGQQYMENSPGGVWCYDPKIGLYQKYTPSNSFSILLNVSGGSLVDGTFLSNQYLPATGNPIKYVNDPTNLIGGLVYNQVYYIIRINASSFKLALTYDDAVAGKFIIPTSTGASTNSFLCIEVQDYGAPYTSGNSGGIAITGQHTVLHDHLLFGQELINGSDNAVYGTCNITIPGFKNIGYFVTSKIVSQNMKDMLSAIFTKWKPLNVGDGIILKVKFEDYTGLPVSSTQLNGITTWVDNKTITTTCNIAEALAYLALETTNEIECEIISGAGAGSMPQVTNIVLNGNSYIITLAETVDGAVAGSYCHFLLNNWKKYDTIDNTYPDTYKKSSVNKPSKWQKVKCILFGVDTTIETLLPITKVQVPAE